MTTGPNPFNYSMKGKTTPLKQTTCRVHQGLELGMVKSKINVDLGLMDFDDLVLELLKMNGRKSRKRRRVLGVRGVVMSNPPPTAEQVIQREIEQERRRLEAMTNQLDLNVQSDVMTEFEESLRSSATVDDKKKT